MSEKDRLRNETKIAIKYIRQDLDELKQTFHDPILFDKKLRNLHTLFSRVELNVLMLKRIK